MSLFSIDSGQFLTITVLAIALGIDAFSLGLGLGLKGIRYLDILKISAVVALFHVLMPLAGMYMGQYAGALLGDVALAAGGGLLALLGLHMIYSSLWTEATRTIYIGSLWGLLLFSLSVSIDSFSVGISLGLFASDVMLTVILFGTFGGLLSVLGLVLGRKVSRWIGEYGETLGGVILLAFGIKFLLG